MLLDDESLNQLNTAADAAMDQFALFMIGYGLYKPVPTAPSFRPGQLSFLEQSYSAGKIAQVLGPKDIKGMTTESLTDLINRAEIPFTVQDQETITRLKQEANTFLEGRAEAWKQRLRLQAVSAERSFAADTLGLDAFEANLVRSAALARFVNGMGGTVDQTLLEVDTLVQTDMASAFQQGFVSGLPEDEVVYKIPRATACQYCLKLHLEADGSPKKYLLSDVQGNSNIGAPASEWEFVLGPVHPHCYCILYRESETPAPGPDKKFEKIRSLMVKSIKVQRREALLKALKGGSIGNRHSVGVVNSSRIA